MSKFFPRNNDKKNGLLVIKVSENVDQNGVNELVTALAKISDFFGVKLIEGSSGGGIPDTIFPHETNKQSEVHNQGEKK